MLTSVVATRGYITNVYNKIHRGIHPCLNSEQDLGMAAQNLIDIISLVLTGKWVKGHYTRKHKEFQCMLSEEVDYLATSYQHQNSKPFHSLACPLTPPDYKFWLVHNNTTITSKLNKIT